MAGTAADASAGITVRLDGAVLHVTLDRPSVRNAMSLAMVDALRGTLAAAEGAGDVRVIVLRGAGGHFCAGADLQDMAKARMASAEGDRDPIAEVNAAFGKLCAAYAGTGLATVAVLEGTVMGGGLGLACVVDVALADETASFRLPETALGVVPAQIAPFLVERLGYSQAKRLAVTGGRLDAAQALAVGLVHEVHAARREGGGSAEGDATASTLDDALAATLERILACAPRAIAATKSLISRARHERPEALVDDAAAIFARAARGPEGVEGMTAFLQKRPPAWAAR
jgi:isohexenylglutaconyl-CoA hydratase